MKEHNDELIALGKQYKTRGEWIAASPRTYQLAYQRGILDSACSHMPQARKVPRVGKRKYTPEELKKIALKYEQRREWELSDRSSYMAAYNYGILDELCTHMPKPRSKRRTLNPRPRKLDADIIKAAQRFQSRADWIAFDNASYQIARRRKILENCTAHMP